MFNITPMDWIIILVILLVIFGPSKITDIAHSLGKSISAFKKGMREGEDELHKTIEQKPAEQKEPPKNSPDKPV